MVEGGYQVHICSQILSALLFMYCESLEAFLEFIFFCHATVIVKILDAIAILIHLHYQILLTNSPNVSVC